jgi:D-glycero-alpha-D-manno-heptose-7-phosphate kinase
VRICDVGGWTDTWFARVGAVLSIAVRPLVEVSVATSPRGAGHQVVLHAPDLDQRDAFDLVAKPGRQPLLEAALEAARLPDDVTVEITIRAGVPPGSGTGTSAAVVVALLGACDRLTPGVTPPLEIARAAHRVETVELGQQSGVQDQLAAACGGINLIEVRYPDADVHRVTVPRRPPRRSSDASCSSPSATPTGPRTSTRTSSRGSGPAVVGQSSTCCGRRRGRRRPRSGRGCSRTWAVP